MPSARRRVLPNGLAVYGVSRVEARRENFLVGEYFRDSFDWRAGMTVFDVGANIGLFSLEVLRRSGGAAQVFAFEPAPSSYELLERNMRELFPGAAVTLSRHAVAAEPGSATFYHRPRLPVISSLRSEAQVDGQVAIDAILREDPDSDYPRVLPLWARRLLKPVTALALRAICWWLAVKVVEVAVEVTTLSKVIAAAGVERIDLLKVDVEGAELDVLEGIEPQDWPKIQAVFAEVHDLSGRVEKMRGLLESAGFQTIHFTQEWPFVGTDIYMLDARREPAAEPATVTEDSVHQAGASPSGSLEHS